MKVISNILLSIFFSFLANISYLQNQLDALENFISKNDTSFKWHTERVQQNMDGIFYKVALVSQLWKGIEWKHRLLIYFPSKASHPYKTPFAYITVGFLIFFFSYLLLYIKLQLQASTILYISVTIIGFILMLTGGTLLSRVIQFKLNNQDIFNKENETFPQEERLIKNEYSINLPALYLL